MTDDRPWTDLIPCVWECGYCHRRGGVRVFPAPGETPEQVAARFAASTRDRCAQGCAMTARSTCLIATKETGGRYFCTRDPGHDGPCAAVEI